MADEVIDRMIVELEAEYENMLSDVKKATDEAEKELGKIGSASEDSAKKSKSAFGGLGDFIKDRLTINIADVVALLANMAKAGVGALVSLGKAAVETNAQFENFETQLTTLLGSTEAAQARIGELAQFGVETPFELPEIVEASRLLQVFGGDLLATGDNLTLIGDAAAGAGQEFQQVAFWTGRLYDAIQSGGPIGEATAELQNMGIIGGDTRRLLERLQKTGADGEEIWAAYADVVGDRFGGGMERLSKTLDGMRSNLADFQEQLLRVGGEAIFEGTKEDLGELLEILNDNQDQIQDFASEIGDLAESIRGGIADIGLDTLREIDPETLDQLIEALDDLGHAITELLNLDLESGINGWIDTLTVIADTLTLVTNAVIQTRELFGGWDEDTSEVSEEMGVLEGIITGVTNAISNLFSPLSLIMDGFEALDGGIRELTGSGISDWSRDLVEDTRTAAQETADLAEEAEELEDAIASVSDTPLKVEVDDSSLGDIEELKEKVGDFALDIMDIQEDVNEQRQELEEEHGERMAEIDEDYNEERLDIEEDFAEKLADLEEESAKKRQEIQEQLAEDLAKLAEETAKKRQEIIEKADKDLADLEEDTNDSIADKQEEYQRNQRRQTEDHQREMKQLQDKYLSSLEDAVAARDARAIVNLRKQHREEVKEAEDGFATQQQRAAEDHERAIEEERQRAEERRQEIEQQREEDLAKLREDEAERRAELQASAAQELQELDENLAEQRAKLEADRTERLAELDEEYAERKAKEEERYAEESEKLDNALKEKLEKIAKELSDENEVTEEGARAILDTLNEHFGIGGNVDQLIEDFVNRKAEKLQIQLELEVNTQIHDAGTSGGVTSQGSGLPGSSTMGGIPEFAEGGSLLAMRPTAAVFGEREPEFAAFMPVSKLREGLSLSGGHSTFNGQMNFSGSAPPGIGSKERDAIARVIVDALQESGMRVSS